MQLGTVKEAVKDHLIPFWEGRFEGRPPAAFLFDQLAEWRQGLTHGSGLLLVKRLTTGNATANLNDFHERRVYPRFVDATIKAY
jgi:hypothetical protein